MIQCAKMDDCIKKVLPDFNIFLNDVFAMNINNQEILEAFNTYVNLHERCKEEWIRKENDLLNQLKLLNKEKTKEKESLERTLHLARKLIDEEKQHRKRAEDDKYTLECRLQEISNLLQDNRNKLHDETRERIQYISTLDQRLSTINESMYHDTTVSYMSDLSYSRSEDDLDIDMPVYTRSKMRRSNAQMFKDHQKSPKKSRSALNTSRSEVITAGPGDCIVTKTTIDVGREGNPIASTVTEAYSSYSNVIPPLKPTKPTAPFLSTDSGESETDGLRNIYSPKIDKTPSRATLNSPSAASCIFPMGMNVMNSRKHSLSSKILIKPVSCDICERKLRFGKEALKCSDCKTICHVECKDKLKLPCILPGTGTPTNKHNFGMLADYAPPTSPMIPAIVYMCVKEIEDRGLNEVGLYRVSGSEKEVKALKEKFLKGRGVHNLSQINDIHVIVGCLKDFFRSLQEPLTTFSQRPRFVEAAQTNDTEARRAALYQEFTKLPQPNRDTLAFLILHLKRVAEIPECRMSISSLSKILGPTIIGYSKPDNEIMHMSIFKESEQSTRVMEELLLIPSEYWDSYMARLPSANPLPCTPSTGSLKNKRCFDSPYGEMSTVKKRKP